MVAAKALGVATVNSASARADALPEGAPSWELLLQTRPLLRETAVTHQHYYRGRPWTIVENRLLGTFYRLDPILHGVFVGEDHGLNLQQRLEKLPQADRALLSAEQVMETYRALMRAELIVDSSGLLPASVFAASGPSHSSKSLWREALTKPFAVRVPLLRPDRWLEVAYRRICGIFNLPIALLSLGLIVWAVLRLPPHWSGLQSYFDAQFVGVGNALLLLALYPLIKLLHELAHGLAIKHWGGRIKEAGLVFLIFIPIPYVDASSSSRFSSKWQRMMVAGAGIWVELVLSAIAFFVWQQASPGVVKLVAFDVMVLGAGSTLLFNANPLLRFDGYYLLADSIEIPNLSTRANRYCSYLIRRYGLGLNLVSAPMNDRHERGWLVGYGVLAYVYRFGLSLVIAFYLSSRFFVVGLIFALWLLLIQLVRPLIAWGRESWQLAAADERRTLQRRVGIATLLLMAVLLTPIPNYTVIKGIVQPPEGALVRANLSGFVLPGFASTGQSLAKGEQVLVMDNPDIEVAVSRLEAQVREVELRQSDALENDLSQMSMFAERAVGLKRQLDDARQESDQLAVKSPSAGSFVSLELRHLEARWLEQGQLVGYVENGAPRHAILVATEDEARKIRQGIEEIEVSEGIGSAIMGAKLTQLYPAANRQLPSALLGSLGGGDIAVDGRDSSGTTSMAPIFKLEIQLLPKEADTKVSIGALVAVRFSHQSRSLAERSGLFLKRFWLEKIEI